MPLYGLYTSHELAITLRKTLFPTRRKNVSDLNASRTARDLSLTKTVFIAASFPDDSGSEPLITKYTSITRVWEVDNATTSEQAVRS